MKQLLPYLVLSYIIVFGNNSELHAQQKPLFSNYIFNQFYYNPAISATSKNIDIRFLYRNQWAGLEGKPHTQTLSAFGAFQKFNLGLGGNVYHDQTGHIRTTGANICASYGISIGEESMISGGLSAGIIHYKLANDINIREAGDLAVTQAQNGKVAPDIGIGLYFKRKGLYAGFSMPQVIQTSLDFEVDDPENKNKLIRHYFLTAGYRFPVSDKFEIEPAALLKAVKGAPLQVDISFRAFYNKMFWLGAAYRSQDAISIMAGAVIKKQFQIGYAYDITTSNLNNVSNGSHEILLAFKFLRDQQNNNKKKAE